MNVAGPEAGKSELDVMGLSQAVCSDMNYMCEVQMRWMNVRDLLGSKKKEEEQERCFAMRGLWTPNLSLPQVSKVSVPC